MAQTLEYTFIGELTIHLVGCEQRIGNAQRSLPRVQNVKASQS